MKALAESQRTMARLLLEFHRAFAPVPVWIIGYSEMKERGLFAEYTGMLRELYAHEPARRTELFLYRHFSMNQFTIDLRRQALENESPGETLDRIGRAYRKRILAF
jgi:hypothetical protein